VHVSHLGFFKIGRDPHVFCAYNAA
jgi:hypothetical protein